MELIRLVISAWKRGREKKRERGKMKERKRVEEDETEDEKWDRKYRQRGSLTKGKCVRVV